MQRNPKRQAGNALIAVLLLLVLVGGALGLNYVRNYQVDQKEEENNRPYARYAVGDLKVLAEGYRMELKAAEERYRTQRVQTRDRHHFSDQIQEFERVQKAARKNRGKAFELADMKRDLQAIEAELGRRSGSGGEIGEHVERMFRL
jgi:hypothetical protein